MRSLVIVIAAIMLLPRPAAAQLDSSRIGCPNCLWHEELERVGTWTDRYPTPQRDLHMTPAEVQTMRGILTRLTGIAHATPVMTALRGVNATAWTRLDLGCSINLVLCRYKTYGAWAEVVVDEHLINENTHARYIMNQESPRLFISVNDPTQLYNYGGHHVEGNGIFDEHGNEVLTVLQKVGEVGGLPLYARQNEGERQSADYITKLLLQELSDMPAGERASDAYGGGGMAVTSGMADANAPGATPLMIFNPDYFDPTLPRTAV